MTDRGIIFSAPMVRALIEGRKTQTRRILKVPGIMGGRYPIHPPEDAIELEPGEFARGIWHYRSTGALSGPYRLPAAVGDRLWVRENFAIVPATAYRHSEGVEQMVCPHEPHDAAIYAAGWDRSKPKWRPSIHMPRWASRLTLIVEAVRVEPLQAISEADAIAEGVEPPATEREDQDWSICPACGGTGLHGALGDNLGYMEVDCTDCDTHAKRYRHLWESLHGPGSWEANPQVVSITFRVERANIDALKEAA